MFAKVKSSVFIDALQLELFAPKGNSVKGVLRDDKGSICCTIEKDMEVDEEKIIWTGLNDLPYGVYSLTLSHEDDEMKMMLVKRI